MSITQINIWQCQFFPPSILRNPTSAQYGELWNIKSPIPTPSYPLSSIRPLEAAIASRRLQELVCDRNTESVLRSMTSFQKAAKCILPELLSVTHQTHFKTLCGATADRTVFSLFFKRKCTEATLISHADLCRGTQGGPRPRIRLIWFISELCNMPYRTQPTDYVWAFASPTVGDSMQVPHRLWPSSHAKNNKSIHSDVVLPPINRPRLSCRHLWNPPKSSPPAGCKPPWRRSHATGKGWWWWLLSPREP